MFFDKTENTILSVQGMHCGHCKAKVENALRAVKGVKKAEANLENGDVNVVYVPAKTSPKALADAVNAIGFTAEVK